jgi:hypothetical protein
MNAGVDRFGGWTPEKEAGIPEEERTMERFVIPEPVFITDSPIREPKRSLQVLPPMLWHKAC